LKALINLRISRITCI